MAEPCGEPLFVALEGLRGCGKSTVAPLLARALDAVQMPTFPAEFSQARAFVDWRSRNADARAHLFVAAVLVTADRVRALLEAGTSVVIDSFTQRTIATHQAFGAALNWEPPADLPTPVTFYLECSAAERQRRLQSRAKAATWWDRLADRQAERIQGHYSRFESHQIDTSRQTPEQTTAVIASIVEGHGRPTGRGNLTRRASGPAKGDRVP